MYTIYIYTIYNFHGRQVTARRCSLRIVDRGGYGDRTVTGLSCFHGSSTRALYLILSHDDVRVWNDQYRQGRRALISLVQHRSCIDRTLCFLQHPRIHSRILSLVVGCRSITIRSCVTFSLFLALICLSRNSNQTLPNCSYTVTRDALAW